MTSHHMFGNIVMKKMAIAAPLPMNQTVRGPRINYEEGRLVFECEYEQNAQSLLFWMSRVH